MVSRGEETVVIGVSYPEHRLITRLQHGRGDDEVCVGSKRCGVGEVSGGSGRCGVGEVSGECERCGGGGGGKSCGAGGECEEKSASDGFSPIGERIEAMGGSNLSPKKKGLLSSPHTSSESV